MDAINQFMLEENYAKDKVIRDQEEQLIEMDQRIHTQSMEHGVALENWSHAYRQLHDRMVEIREERDNYFARYRVYRNLAHELQGNIMEIRRRTSDGRTIPRRLLRYLRPDEDQARQEDSDESDVELILVRHTVDL